MADDSKKPTAADAAVQAAMDATRAATEARGAATGAQQKTDDARDELRRTTDRFERRMDRFEQRMEKGFSDIRSEMREERQRMDAGFTEIRRWQWGLLAGMLLLVLGVLWNGREPAPAPTVQTGIPPIVVTVVLQGAELPNAAAQNATHANVAPAQSQLREIASAK